ncbi:hypothetical protein SAMN05216390_102365 [Lachnospiraceae bacterium KH1T2]|nr:hypothetical protein SAMN05216390_102365 [Lachnospiraceae bacterium KH1T2]
MVYWNNENKGICNYERLKYQEIFENEKADRRKLVEEFIRFIPSNMGEVKNLMDIVDIVNEEIVKLNISDANVIDSAEKLSLQFRKLQQDIEISELLMNIEKLSGAFSRKDVAMLKSHVMEAELNMQRGDIDGTIFSLEAICENYEYILKNVIYLPDNVYRYIGHKDRSTRQCYECEKEVLVSPDYKKNSFINKVISLVSSTFVVVDC